MTCVRALALLTALLPWFAGCPPERPDGVDGDDDADDDAVDDDDVVDDDDIADDDDIVDDDIADDDDVADDDDAVPESTDGYVSVLRSEDPYGGETSYFTAILYEVVVEPVLGVVYEQPSGPGDCALTTYTLDDLYGGTDGQLDYQSAGTLTLDGPAGSFTVEPENGRGGYIGYTVELPNTPQLMDADHDVTAAGAQFPGFDIAGAIETPAQVRLEAPEVDTSFVVGGAMTVQWAGGDPVPLWITLMASSATGQEYGVIMCQADNDGEFTIDAGLVGQLPSGSAYLQLVQSNVRYEQISGRWLAFSGSSNVTAYGNNP
jgi:hypothetical protein